MAKRSEETVSVRNIYHMLSYALDAHNIAFYDNIAFEEINGLYNLLVEILVQGTVIQRKRGLDHGYSLYREAIPTIWGRVHVGSTLRLRNQGSNMIDCSFDEYTTNTFLNQILKAALIKSLTLGEISSDNKRRIKGLLPFFDEVADIPTHCINWGGTRLNRNNASYRLLLNVCYMLINETGMTQYLGTLAAPGITVKNMPLLYQHFVLNYFKRHFPDLRVRGEIKLSDGIERNSVLLPELHPDITLTGEEKMLIIDTKYYGEILSDNRGKKSISSSNRNQILSYVLHSSEGFDGIVSGMLLYAKTDHESEQDTNFEWRELGHDFSCRTLDLNRSFEKIAASLNRIAESLDAWCSTTQ